MSIGQPRTTVYRPLELSKPEIWLLKLRIGNEDSGS
jgi:hypothetical protein